jgi:hypothetical protein
VVYHSSLWTYLSTAEQDRIRELLAESGARATARRPLAWLRHEDSGELGAIEIRSTLWPDGREWILGAGHPHGRRVVWYETPSPVAPRD